MAFTLRSVKGPANSADLEEASTRVFEFFKTVCRSLPSIMEIYNLDDITTKSQLRSIIAAEIRKNSHITNPKGTEELNNILEHAKQVTTSLVNMC